MSDRNQVSYTDDEKTPSDRNKKKDTKEGSVMESVAAFGVFLGEAILFTGLVGLAILFLDVILGYLGIWAIPAAVLTGAGLKGACDYMIKRSQGRTKDYSITGAVLGYVA